MRWLIALLLLTTPALAQPTAGVPTAAPGSSAAVAVPVQGVTGGVPMAVSGTFSASLAGFAPSGNYATLAVTTTTGQTTIPSGSPAVVAASNVGSNPLWVNLGTSGSVTATTGAIYVPAGCTVPLTVGANTNIAAISTGGSTTLNMAGGTGLFTPFCSGGSGGSGGNVNVNQVGGSAYALGQTTMSASQPVVIASNQSGVPVTGTFFQATQPVSAAALPLPSGAATAANQTSVQGTAGSPAATVESIQGVAGGTAVPVSGTFYQATQPVSAASLPLPSGAATSANQRVTAAGTTDTSAQAVQGVTGGVALPVSASSLPLPTGAATSANQSTEISSLATIATNTGAATPAGTNLIGKVGIDQTTPGTTNGVQVNAALPAGTNLIGKFGIDQTTPGTTNGVQIAAALPAGTNTIGAVSQVAPTSGGWTVSSAIVPNNTTAVVLKASAGQVARIEGFNISATPAYLKIYNATSATCGSGTPVARYLIPQNGTNGAGSATGVEIGDAYSTGITYCVTTGIGDADTTAPAANSYIVNVHWK